MRRDAREALRRLGQRIHVLRRERGLSQETLAAACSLSQKYLSEVERAVKAPSFETLVALAHRGFRIRLTSLLFGLDDDLTPEERRVEDLLAGRPASARARIVSAVSALLAAGGSPTVAALGSGAKARPGLRRSPAPADPSGT